jgi:PKD repeat protein
LKNRTPIADGQPTVSGSAQIADIYALNQTGRYYRGLRTSFPSGTASPTNRPAPLTVQFIDTSTGSPTGWNWNFGDGLSSTAQSPSRTYEATGSFVATPTVSGSGDQTNSASQTITVTNAPPPAPATITAVASQPLATSLTPGAFTLARTGSTAAPLTVSYTLGGTAVNGINYQALTGAVVIPERASSTTLPVNPIGLLDVLQTVVLSVSPNPDFSLGSPDSATVTIVVSL